MFKVSSAKILQFVKYLTKLLFDPRGDIKRKDFWIGAVFAVLIIIPIRIAVVYMGGWYHYPTSVKWLIVPIYVLLSISFYLSLPIQIKRTRNIFGTSWILLGIMALGLLLHTAMIFSGSDLGLRIIAYYVPLTFVFLGTVDKFRLVNKDDL